MATLYSTGNIESSNGQGPAGNEIPYWRVISSEMKFYWPSVGLFTPQSIDPADYNFMVQGSTTGLNHFVVSSANPDSGTYHLRTGIVTNDASTFVAVGDQNTGLNSQAGPVGFAINNGDQITVSWRVAFSNSDSISDEVVNLIIQTMNTSGTRNFFVNNEYTPTQNDGTYETYSETFTFSGYATGHTLWTPHVNWFHNGNESNYPTVDIDNITVTGPDSVLYVSNAGFRFPYPRWT